MTSVSVPDGAHYVVMVCIPNGDATMVECQYSDGLDDATALVLIEFGKNDVLGKKARAEAEAGKMKLMLPVPSRTEPPTQLSVQRKADLPK